MATLASLNIELGAVSAGLAAETAKARGTMRSYYKDVGQMKRESEGGGGLFGIGKALRAEARESKQSGEGQVKALLTGGATLGIGGFAAEVLEKMSEKWRDIANEAREGKMAAGEFTEKMAASLPIIGQIWTAGRNIKSAVWDIAAGIAQWAGASKETVDGLESDETKLKRAKEEAEAMNAVLEKTSKMKAENGLIGLKGQDLIVAKNKKEIAEFNEEFKKLKKEMDESAAWKEIDPHIKSGILNDFARAGEAGINNKSVQEMKERAEERTRAIAEGEQKMVELQASLDEQRLRNSGRTQEAEAAGAAASYGRQIAEVRKWAEEMKKDYPEAAAEIERVAGRQRDLIKLQAEAARQAPLINALRQIKDENRDAGLDAIQRRILALQELGATEKQIAAARVALQQAEDKQRGKAIRESVQTPIEALLKEQQELQRMLDEEAITPKEFRRALGDAEAKARRELGGDGEAKKATKVERRFDFSMPVEPKVADPLAGIAKATSSTLIEAREQTRILRDQAKRGIAVVNIEDF